LSGLQQRGAAPEWLFFSATGFPFHQRHGCGARNPKRSDYTSSPDCVKTIATGVRCDYEADTGTIEHVLLENPSSERAEYSRKPGKRTSFAAVAT
jgi:hypothetical protein